MREGAAWHTARREFPIAEPWRKFKTSLVNRRGGAVKGGGGVVNENVPRYFISIDHTFILHVTKQVYECIVFRSLINNILKLIYSIQIFG